MSRLKKSSKNSFTLIELLVVIAIIGLLASIVVVNVNSARQKAQIAKAVAFSQQIYRALGSEAVGAWSFSEGSGGTTADNSGNGNVGTINGATWVDGLTFSGGSFGKALSFDGINDYVDVGNVASLNPIYITLEAWIKPTNQLSGGQVIVKRDNAYAFFESGIDWLYINGSWSNRYNINSLITNNVWQHVVNTYDGATSKAYINGVLVASGTISGTLTSGSTGKTIIGNSESNDRDFNGLIDEVRIYSKALSQAQIQQHYAEGLEKHKNLAVK